MNLSTLQIVRPIPEEANAFLTVLARVGRLAVVYGAIAAAGVLLAPVMQAFGIWGAFVALVGCVVTAAVTYWAFVRASWLLSGEKENLVYSASDSIVHGPRRAWHYGQAWVIRRKRKRKRRKRAVLRRVPLPRDGGRDAVREEHEAAVTTESWSDRLWAAWSSVLTTIAGIGALGAGAVAVLVVVRHLEPFILGASAGISLSTIAGFLHLLVALLGSGVTLRTLNKTSKRRRKKR